MELNTPPPECRPHILTHFWWVGYSRDHEMPLQVLVYKKTVDPVSKAFPIFTLTSFWRTYSERSQLLYPEQPWGEGRQLLMCEDTQAAYRECWRLATNMLVILEVDPSRSSLEVTAVQLGGNCNPRKYLDFYIQETLSPFYPSKLFLDFRTT